MADDLVKQLENRIALLETKLRQVGIKPDLGRVANFSSGSCTNNCTAACTIGCTSGCTKGCVADPLDPAIELSPVRAEAVGVEAFQKLRG